MASFIQVVCLTLLAGMAYSWSGPLLFEGHIPVAYVHTSVEEGSAPPSILDEMSRIMTNMHEHFEKMFKWPSPITNFYDDDEYDMLNGDEKLVPLEDLLMEGHKLPLVDDLTDVRKKLDSVQPVCTTITDNPTTISPRKSRRKKLRPTHTTTCIRELVHNGQKHVSEEVTVSDDKGTVLKHSKSYGMTMMDIEEAKLSALKSAMLS